MFWLWPVPLDDWNHCGLWVGLSEVRFPDWFIIDYISTGRSTILFPLPSWLKMVLNHLNRMVHDPDMIQVVAQILLFTTSLRVGRRWHCRWFDWALILLITLFFRSHDPHPQVNTQWTDYNLQLYTVWSLGWTVDRFPENWICDWVDHTWYLVVILEFISKYSCRPPQIEILYTWKYWQSWC